MLSCWWNAIGNADDKATGLPLQWKMFSQMPVASCSEYVNLMYINISNYTYIFLSDIYIYTYVMCIYIYIHMFQLEHVTDDDWWWWWYQWKNEHHSIVWVRQAVRKKVLGSRLQDLFSTSQPLQSRCFSEAFSPKCSWIQQISWSGMQVNISYILGRCDWWWSWICF